VRATIFAGDGRHDAVLNRGGEVRAKIFVGVGDRGIKMPWETIKPACVCVVNRSAGIEQQMQVLWTPCDVSTSSDVSF
jgi:hypothetical protein